MSKKINSSSQTPTVGSIASIRPDQNNTNDKSSGQGKTKKGKNLPLSKSEHLKVVPDSNHYQFILGECFEINEMISHIEHDFRLVVEKDGENSTLIVRDVENNQIIRELNANELENLAQNLRHNKGYLINKDI